MPEVDKVYIVILNWNSFIETNSCLQSLLKLDYENYSIVICDNGSTNNSLEEIDKYLNSNKVAKNKFTFSRGNIEHIPQKDSQEIILINNEANLGYAAGNNIGIRVALSDSATRHIWVLNNDTVVKSDSLCCLVKKTKKHPGYGICGSRLIYDHDRSKLQGFGGVYDKYTGLTKHYLEGENSEIVIDEDFVAEHVDYIIGASVLFSRSFVEYCGGFCEDYFLYFEELDLSQRLNHTFTKIIAQDSIVFHKEGASFEQALRGTSLYYLHRNRVFFTKKYHRNMLFSVISYALWQAGKRFVKADLSGALTILKATFNIPLYK